ncbi:MAG: SCP2 sterol-binding domain-containing protein [Promethearchaeota archaeon]|jgi:putative sterol carrier protein
MLESKRFSSVVLDLENNNEEFIEGLNQVIKFAVSYINNTEELSEEILDYDDTYQIIIKDINFNFWFRVSNGKILYKKGINREASLRINYTKDLFVKILKRETAGTDAYMKGKIKVNGDLTQGLRFTKIFQLFLKHNLKRESKK